MEEYDICELFPELKEILVWRGGGGTFDQSKET
jgi:hypothetical protein